MPAYNYKAVDKYGKFISGFTKADSEAALSAKFKQNGYTIISIADARERKPLSKFEIFRGVRFADLNLFTRQFYILQKAGIPLKSALYTLIEQTTSKVLRQAIIGIAEDIEQGLSLSAAMGKYPKIFNELYINMIKAGETAGTLKANLERLMTIGEDEERIRFRIKSATRYPIIVIVAVLIAFTILTTAIIPRFANLYAKFKVNLPLPTVILLGINYAITKFWWLTLIILGIVIFLFYKFINTKKGRWWWDGFKLKVPIFGPLIMKLIMSRFTRIISVLMESGVPILDILDLGRKGAGNVVIEKVISDIKNNVTEGKGMAEPMRSSGMFPALVSQMVAVGEETGKISELLLHVSDYYNMEIDYTVNNMVTLIEPLLILILGSGILFMALGVFLPIWNLMSLFRK
jgi:type II secretory pathway component PulF